MAKETKSLKSKQSNFLTRYLNGWLKSCSNLRIGATWQSKTTNLFFPILSIKPESSMPEKERDHKKVDNL